MAVIKKESEAELTSYNNENIKGMLKKLIIGSSDGEPTMALRIMEVEVGGYSPFHSHNWEHINYILSGEGALKTIEGEVPLLPGMSVFVKPDEKHQYVNKGNEKFRFICMVPVERE